MSLRHELQPPPSISRADVGHFPRGLVRKLRNSGRAVPSPEHRNSVSRSVRRFVDRVELYSLGDTYGVRVSVILDATERYFV